MGCLVEVLLLVTVIISFLFSALLDLEALFSPAHLEALYLTVRLSEPPAFFLNSLMNGLVERRRGGALRSLNLHIPKLTIPKESPLFLLLPQLEHFGVHCEGQLDAKPLLEVAVAPKLLSLKLANPIDVPLNSVVPLLARLTTMELSFFRITPRVSIMLSHCRALVSLKLNKGSHYINVSLLSVQSILNFHFLQTPASNSTNTTVFFTFYCLFCSILILSSFVRSAGHCVT